MMKIILGLDDGDAAIVFGENKAIAVSTASCVSGLLCMVVGSSIEDDFA
jgi:hypothetical protein